MVIERWRAAVDTDVLVYAEGSGDDRRQDLAIEWMGKLNSVGYVLPVQVAGEFLRVQRKKLRRTALDSIAALKSLALQVQLAPTTAEAFAAAQDAVAQRGFDIWDAIVLSVASENKCAILLSEDMQDGFVWRGVTVCNPFAEKLHPLLASALND
jgi:predicted nucleic acid-binding protein